MSPNYWLMKCEPNVYSISDLERDGWTFWEGVRNYQARNFMRDEFRVGDHVLFYHSNADPSGVAGLATVIRDAYVDHFAQDPENKYFDPKATPDNPRWVMVDIQFVKKFQTVIALQEMRHHPTLSDMMVLQKGSRLSITPITKANYEYISALSEPQ